jgi:hypothetical protein
VPQTLTPSQSRRAHQVYLDALTSTSASPSTVVVAKKVIATREAGTSGYPTPRRTAYFKEAVDIAIAALRSLIRH